MDNEIENLTDLDLEIRNKEVTISLLKESKDDYSVEMLNLLTQFAKQVEKYKDKIEKVNLVVLNERLPYDKYLILEYFYTKTKHIFDTNLIVKHKIKYSDKPAIEKLWNIETIIKANSYIDNICDKIKSLRMSPAETLAYIHFVAQTISTYNVSEDQSWCSNDQIFAGAFLKKPEYVCAGCASLVKKIIDTLNMPELKCEMIGFTAINLDTDNKERHLRLNISLCDKKYKIQDSFYMDPTWDFPNDRTLKYSHLLLTKDCHDENMSKYDYYDFVEVTVDEKSVHYHKDFYPQNMWYNQSVKPLEQNLVEEIVFNALVNFSDKNFEDTYDMMKNMASISYNEQVTKRYKNKFISPNLQLNKNRAKEIYNQYKTDSVELEM